MLRRRFLVPFGVACAFAFVVAAPLTARPAAPRAADLPSHLTDQEFAQLSADLSEPPGSFRSENLVSNETMFQWVIPDLAKTVKPGGVYMGVAPDQNFTYIGALQPKIAFIVDIRRGNVLEHLLYKALIEMSADRAEFLARLFSCKRPEGVGTNATAEQLLRPFEAATRDGRLFEENQKAVLDWLEKRHGFRLSADDEVQLKWIYGAFYSDGPELTYQSYQGGVPMSMPFGLGRGGGRGGRAGGFAGGRGGFGFGGGFATYGELQMETDAQGGSHAYLASEANFTWLKTFESRNLIVPITGDFAGPKAIRAVGQWVREHGATITTVYTSNVEQYLFQQGDDWSRYYKNVSTLPLDDTSTFIRSVPGAMVVPAQPGARAASMLCSMTGLAKSFAAGKIRGYGDVIAMCRQAEK